ncbi:MAG: dehydrogenase, partial [Verrucomicrobiota bacterium]
PEIAARARQLGSLWGDAAALQASLARLHDATAPEADRIGAIRTARQLKTDDVRKSFLQLVAAPGSDAVRVEAVRALTEAGVDETGKELLAGWNNYTPAVRRAVAELCTTRWQWKWPFFGAVERGEIKRGDIPPTVIRTLAGSKAEPEREKALQLFGKVQASSAEKLQLIAAKRKVVIEGPVDLAAGREAARKSCLVCHKLHGEGAEVGPDLTGVGRSSLDALLHNVIHPNEIIGQGYENVIVETRDDRSVAGRLVEDSPNRVRLLQAGGHEEVVARGDVKTVTVSPNSVMPEGLEQMPDAEFRNLIWFILAPPEDGRPWSEERRRELIGGGDSAAVAPARDGESIALWAPEWRVESPDFEGAPAKLPEFAGRRNVLLTHPRDERTPAAIVRVLTLPAGSRAGLRFSVAAHEQGDWQLRVLADGELIHQRVVDHDAPRWKDVRLDLSRFGGRRVVLRLENAANDWRWEFGHWADLRIEDPPVAAR